MISFTYLLRYRQAGKIKRIYPGRWVTDFIRETYGRWKIKPSWVHLSALDDEWQERIGNRGFEVETNHDFGTMASVENRLDVETILRRLPERDRKILWLHCQGFTLKEIGLQFGRSESAISLKLPKIVAKLREFVSLDEI